MVAFLTPKASFRVPQALSIWQLIVGIVKRKRTLNPYVQQRTYCKCSHFWTYTVSYKVLYLDKCKHAVGLLRPEMLLQKGIFRIGFKIRWYLCFSTSMKLTCIALISKKKIRKFNIKTEIKLRSDTDFILQE